MVKMTMVAIWSGVVNFTEIILDILNVCWTGSYFICTFFTKTNTIYEKILSISSKYKNLNNHLYLLPGLRTHLLRYDILRL